MPWTMGTASSICTREVIKHLNGGVKKQAEIAGG